MNNRENNNYKTISKASLRKEESKTKNIKDRELSKYNKMESYCNTNNVNNLNNINNTNNEIFINTNRYSNMLEDIENETYYINEQFIQECNIGSLTRNSARKKENKGILNTYVSTNKVVNKKNRNKNRLEKELNMCD